MFAAAKPRTRSSIHTHTQSSERKDRSLPPIPSLPAPHIAIRIYEKNAALLLLLRHYSMTITSNTRMFFSSAAVITWVRIFTQEHLAMLTDTMAFVLWDTVLTIMRRCLGGSPREIISPDLNVVVCEFTELIVVHAEKLCFLGCAEVEAGDEVDGVGDDGGHDEGVAGGCDNVGDLDVELFVVVIDPAAGDYASVDTVKPDNVTSTEESVGEESEHTSDTVLSKNVHGVVDSEPVLNYNKPSAIGNNMSCLLQKLTFSAIIAYNASNDA